MILQKKKKRKTHWPSLKVAKESAHLYKFQQITEEILRIHIAVFVETNSGESRS